MMAITYAGSDGGLGGGNDDDDDDLSVMPWQRYSRFLGVPRSVGARFTDDTFI